MPGCSAGLILSGGESIGQLVCSVPSIIRNVGSYKFIFVILISKVKAAGVGSRTVGVYMMN